SLLLRYGVYTIYFGAARLPGGGNTGSRHEPFWLHKIVRICRALVTFLDSLISLKTQTNDIPMANLDVAMNNYQTALCEAAALQGGSTNGKIGASAATTIVTPLDIHGIPTRGPDGINLEIAVLNAALQLGFDFDTW